MQGYLRKFRTKQDAAILINEKALAEWPVSVVKEALDVTGRKIIQDGTGRLYLAKKEAA